MRRNLTGNTEQKAHQRDKALTSTDWMVIRHRDEKDEGSGTTLTAKQYKDLLKYRKALRDWNGVGPLPTFP